MTGALPVLDRKLLMLASAVATEPRLLLMDEPVGGLNAAEIDRMMTLVQSLRGRGITIILIEHVMRFLVQLASRVLILHHGEAIYEGSPRGLVEDRTVIDVYLGEGASKRLGSLMRAMAGS
jgi:branched-chain amino acid transport system ATP-binding protein